MITKEITILDKQVTLAYCYSTEISYKLLAEEECTDFIKEVITSIQTKRMPDSRKSIYLIMAAMTAYYESQSQENPIKDKELIYYATPEDIGKAIGTIAGLYIEFYKIPVGEPEDKQEKGNRNSRKRKNT